MRNARIVKTDSVWYARSNLSIARTVGKEKRGKKMKSVLISVNKPNTDNIHKGIKTSELRTNLPKIPPPFKVYMYETLKGGEQNAR